MASTKRERREKRFLPLYTRTCTHTQKREGEEIGVCKRNFTHDRREICHARTRKEILEERRRKEGEGEQLSSR